MIFFLRLRAPSASLRPLTANSVADGGRLHTSFYTTLKAPHSIKGLIFQKLSTATITHPFRFKVGGVKFDPPPAGCQLCNCVANYDNITLIYCVSMCECLYTNQRVANSSVLVSILHYRKQCK